MNDILVLNLPYWTDRRRLFLKNGLISYSERKNENHSNSNLQKFQMDNQF